MCGKITLIFREDLKDTRMPIVESQSSASSESPTLLITAVALLNTPGFAIPPIFLCPACFSGRSTAQQQDRDRRVPARDFDGRFSLDAFVVGDERLHALRPGHDRLNNNAHRVQEGSGALELYHHQVQTLEERNIELVIKVSPLHGKYVLMAHKLRNEVWVFGLDRASLHSGSYSSGVVLKWKSKMVLLLAPFDIEVVQEMVERLALDE
ncbi:hypothetical protein C8R46DRAFT_1051949 [Mycena filopes]|nr:hypothetical protein C8R46DRAFT_1051949 [Mycena filopes]